ncbi:MAG: hypothetical protein MJ225_03545 [Bacilli bacterium]|nr:hypothetical protein [Bacilli bacterium]
MSHQNKKVRILACLSLLGLFALASCSKAEEDPTYAKPSNYLDPIVTIDGKKDIHNNILKIVYDQLHKENVPSDVASRIMYLYGNTVFGYYNKLTLDAVKAYTNVEDEITLKDAYAGTLVGAPTESVKNLKDFINAHRAYWYVNDNGIRVADDGKTLVTEDNWSLSNNSLEVQHVKAKWDAIENRIAEEMYNLGVQSNTERYYFNEIKYITSLNKGMHKVGYKQAIEHNPAIKPVLVEYTVEPKDVFEPLESGEYLLHREFYQDSIQVGVKEDFDWDDVQNTYVEDEIIEGIYNDLLIEQYLLDEDMVAIKSSKARKINVIKIEKYSDFTINADMLVKELVNEIYTLPSSDTEHVMYEAQEIEDAGDELFSKYDTVSKGLYDVINDGDHKDEAALVTKLQSHASDVFEEAKLSGKTFYKHTAAADKVKDYDKVVSATSWTDLDESLYNSLTDSGKISPEEGLQDSLNSIKQTKNITKDWFVESQKPGLPGEITDRLFKLSVGNGKLEVPENASEERIEEALEPIEELDRLQKEQSGEWTVRKEMDEDENKFLCSINGTYYLKFEGQSSKEDWKNDIVYDDGSAYYVVQVLEAVNNGKLRSGSKECYSNVRSQTFMDEAIDEICKIVGSSGNYASVSKNYWLKKMVLTYHDQEVYNYFKENFPDLFED